MVPTTAQNESAAGKLECIWMQAGVVSRKHCRLVYECTTCRYDRVMQRTARENQRMRRKGRQPGGKRGRIVFWRDKLRELSAPRRPCLHHMKGRIDFRSCTHDYQCGNCDFDQYFNDQFTVHAMVRPVELSDIKGIKLPQGYYLHKGHCWAKLEADSAVRVGLDDFALRLLGPPDTIEAPLMGKTVEQGRGDIRLRREDHLAALLAPVTGVVTDINPRLRERGSQANRDPYADGWVMRLHATDLRNDLKQLMIGSQASDFMDDEVERLYEVIEETAGPLAADGGQLGPDIYGSLPSIGWNRILNQFLRSGS
jgi:glycine cleavage system H lipoate-binding protein